jgi:acetyltransferase
MIASATPEQVERAMRIIVADPGIDAVIASYVPLGLEAPVIAAAINRGSEGCGKPILAVLMSKRGLPQGMAELDDTPIPAYRFPESAARALGAMWRYRQWLDRPVGRSSPRRCARNGSVSRCRRRSRFWSATGSR